MRVSSNIKKSPSSVWLRRSLPALFLVLSLATTLFAQKQSKPWTEWSKKEAEAILNDSPWGRTQVETDVSEMFYSPTARGGAGATGGSRTAQGATNSEIYVRYHIRFFSARPVRQAHIRMLEINDKDLDQETSGRMHNFAELIAKDSIILTVTYESNDQRYSGKTLQLLGSRNTGSLKNSTYLERNDGQRLFLEEYVPPGKDGFGARFIFRRHDDGIPFVTADTSEIRFFSEVSKDLKLNMKFKVADMMYDGKLEY